MILYEYKCSRCGQIREWLEANFHRPCDCGGIYKRVYGCNFNLSGLPGRTEGHRHRALQAEKINDHLRRNSK